MYCIYIYVQLLDHDKKNLFKFGILDEISLQCNSLVAQCQIV